MDTTYVIHKQILDHNKASIDGMLAIDTPCGSELLSIQVQKNQICVWYQLPLIGGDESSLAYHNELDRKVFRFVPTGGGDRRKHKYWSTCLLDNGELVLHVFEVTSLNKRIKWFDSIKTKEKAEKEKVQEYVVINGQKVPIERF